MRRHSRIILVACVLGALSVGFPIGILWYPRWLEGKAPQEEEVGSKAAIVAENTIILYQGERIGVLSVTPGVTSPPAPTPTVAATPEAAVLIVDDTGSGFSTVFAQDNWGVFQGTSGELYGGGHRYNRQIGTGQDVATWAFAVSQPGRYQVSAWWYASSWRPTDVPYSVNHESGTDTVRVDQQVDGGQWNALGVFDFRDQGSVSVSDDVASGQGIIADAIRLVYVGPLSTPAPTPTATLTHTVTPTPTSTPTLTPGGSVRYVSPGDKLSSAIGQLGPGDTLILRSGVYRSSMTIGVSGTAAQPITVRAEHDGAAVVDGQMVRSPLRVSGQHVVVEGIRFQNGSGSTVVVNGQHVTLRRVSAYTSGDGNVHVYEIAYTSDVLLEDCAASGKGRNLYLLYESDHVILRRCWGHWMARNGTGEANEWGQFYATSDCRIENSVGTYDSNAAVSNVVPVAFWIADWNAPGLTNNRNVVEGSIFYGYPYHNGVWTGTQGSREQRDNVVRGNVFVSDRGYTEIFQRGGQNLVIEGNTFVNNGLAWASVQWDGGTSAVLRQNSFVGGAALAGSIPTARYDNNYWVDRINAPLGPGSTTIDPAYDTVQHGTGAYLKRPPGITFGAEILYDGQGNLLWPWPMEARICAETAHLFGGGVDGRSVTYQAHQIQYDLDANGQPETYNCSGGVWHTLAGVY